MPIEILTYKNKPILRITPEGKAFPRVQFGLNKAKLIIDHIEAIKEFVAKVERDALPLLDTSAEDKTNVTP